MEEEFKCDLRDINGTGRPHTGLLSLRVAQGSSNHGHTALEIRNAVTALAHCARVAIFATVEKQLPLQFMR